MAVVGRDRALAGVDRVLAALTSADPGPRALRLSGDAGIGKTRLLNEVTARARVRGYSVLEGRAAEFDVGVPFGAVVGALDDLAARVHSSWASESEGVVLTAERYRIHRAIASRLAEHANTTPLVLAVDDLHWADEASVELVLHLLEAPPPRVLLVVTDRPRQVDGRVSATFARAQAAGRAVAIELGPLTRADADRLLDHVEPAARDRIYAESDGNPFFLIELARAAHAPGDEPMRGEVPSAVRAVIAREIAALSADARAFASGGAIAGDPFDPRAASVAAAIPEEHGLALLDELVTGGLLVETGEPRLFRFRHPIVRRAVYEHAGAGWRLGAHRRLADALAAEDASPLLAAQHVALVARPGDSAAIDLLASAGALAQPSSPMAAAAWYGEALRLVPFIDARRRIELLTRKAAALRSGGRTQESRDALVEALSLVRESDTETFVRLAVECAAVEHLLGWMDQARARLQGALEKLDGHRSPLGATLLAELAVNAGWFRGDWPAADRFASEATQVARDTRAGAAEALALVVLAFAAYTAGRTTEAAAALERAADLVDHLGDSDLSDHLDVLNYLARSEFFTDRNAAALRHADRGIALCRSTGQSPFLHLLLGVRASALRTQGRLGEAATASNECVAAARLGSDPQALLVALMDLVHLDTIVGDIDHAIALAEEALDLAAGLPTTMINTTIAWGAAAAFLEAGDTERAALLLFGPQGRASLESAPLPGPILAWQLIARTLTRQGRLIDAQRWVERIDDALAHVADIAAPQVWRGTAAAELLIAQQEPHEAATAALAAADAAENAGLFYDASRARLLAGRALSATSERERAIALLRRSRTELQHYGADRYADEAAQELRRLGERIGRGGRRGQGSGGAAALSDRERAVADLVVTGRTNKEIGDVLFLSTRTVERHLSHVFDKLGIESRAQLGALLASSSAPEHEP